MSGTTTFYKLHHKLDFSRSCYVGSTSNYAKRIHNHKFNCTNPTSEKYNFKVYQYIRENGGFDDWTFSILEHLETVDKPQRLRMERDFISKHGATLNKQNPGIFNEIGLCEYNRIAKDNDNLCDRCNRSYRGKGNIKQHQKSKKCLRLYAIKLLQEAEEDDLSDSE